MANINKENPHEKHYSPDILIEEMFSILERNHHEPITEFLETSAGSGNIVNHFIEKGVTYQAYDIFNETHREDITQLDYLKHKIEYKEGRVTIMNPPFNKGLKFLYKSLQESDYVVSIMSANSLLNLDYSKVWVDEIQFYKRFPFEKCNVSIILLGCRKKTELDKYEFK